MAIYRLSAQILGRSSGDRAIAAAAYRAAERLYDERLGLTVNYTRKRGVVHTEILAPEGAPAWVTDRQRLWNEVELRENYKNGQLAREIQVALPVELTPEQRIELTREFVREQFVARGMVADICWHEPKAENPHAHIMLTLRSIGPEGFGKKDTSWNKRALMFEWRERWAEHTNLALARAGHEERVDHRSYAERGIDLEAQPKRWRTEAELEAASAVAKKHLPEGAAYDLDGSTRVLEDYRRVAYENGERIYASPEIALRLLTQQRSHFRREDLLKVLNTHTLDADQFERCLQAVMASPELVALGPDARGVERFSSREMVETEQRLLAAAKAMHGELRHQVQARFVEQAARLRATLTVEQQQALEHLTSQSGALALLEGHAGTGKSFLLDAARDAWEAQGLVVVGGALAGKAAAGLSESSGIESRTLASWERAWDREQAALTSKHVLVIDEAGMVGTRQLERVLRRAHRAGAKVVLVGDSQQLQAIEAGSPFRALSAELGSGTLSEVRRQRIEWQRHATQAFAGGRAAEGLAAYHDHGLVRAHMRSEQAREAVVASWTRDQAQVAVEQQLLLAYRRDDVLALNELARQARQQQGALGRDQVFATEYGERRFAKGDRVYFGRNDRSLGVTNGSLGTVEAIRGQVMLVRLDGAERKQVLVDLEQYRHVDHGYAVTVHKSQGVTVDRTYVLASKLFEASTSYVSLSRHREHVELHWARDEFGTRAELDRTLTRVRVKELATELAELDVLEGQGRASLSEVLEDDSRFGLLSPAEQRRLVEACSAELSQVGKRMLSSAEVFEQLPEQRAAKKQIEEASERVATTRHALDRYEHLGFLDKLRVSKEALIEAHNKATDALHDARRQQRVNEPALRQRASAIVGRHNTPLVEQHYRLKDLQEKWRNEMLARERAGWFDHALSKLSGYRMATDRDAEQSFQVAGTFKLGPLEDGRPIHVVALVGEQKQRVLLEVGVDHFMRSQKGQQVLLERSHGGPPRLMDRNRGRGGIER